MKHKKVGVENELAGDPGFCLCDETVLFDPALEKLYRVKKPKWHDCEYIRRVGSKVFANALIADKMVDGYPDVSVAEKEIRNRTWQQCFARHMDYDRAIILKEMKEDELLDAKIRREQRALELLEAATHAKAEMGHSA